MHRKQVLAGQRGGRYEIVMKATWNGQVIAQSEDAVLHDGYWYFPRQSVEMALLSKAAKTAGDQACPHGVQFYDIAAKSPRAAWSYEAPRPAMDKIGQWIGFWEDVAVGE